MIKIQNVYYMLAYAFSVLREQGYRDLATEEFPNTADLCAAILVKGISSQVKRGLARDYVPRSETLSTVRGKINVAETVRRQTLRSLQVVCNYDEFTIDSQLNRILKAAMLLLLKANIEAKRKRELRSLLVYFAGVAEIDPRRIDWNVHYERNNRSYRMLVAVCWLVVKGLLQTQQDGRTRMMDFLDEQRMHRLYEKFVLEYYRAEHPELNASAPQIPWALDESDGSLLPVMQTDVTLTKGAKVLIIDTKYYSRALQQYFDAYTIRSAHLYQIFTYVKNKEAALADVAGHEVSGMLLYAKTDEELAPDNTYLMGGNRISVRTLDLGQDFSVIKEQLDGVVGEFFG